MAQDFGYVDSPAVDYTPTDWTPEVDPVKKVTLAIYGNEEKDEVEHYFDLYELFLKAGYKIPYSRWASGIHKRFGVAVIKRLEMDNPTGRPRVHYYAKVEKSQLLLEWVARRMRLKIDFE